ncbi:uncharacterized protein LOC134585653 [Pelobates fuscus]|uniref:uncharacterized protein LOC134585653 n=1 Tax=Pelobates fuscus TaxID=191477 RepID=UPI002FE443F4
MGLPAKDVPCPKSASPRMPVPSVPRKTSQKSVTTPRTPSHGKAVRDTTASANVAQSVSAGDNSKLTRARNATTPRDSGDARKSSVSSQRPSSSSRTRQSPDVPSTSEMTVKMLTPSSARQFSVKDVEKIEKDTRGQRDNPEWFNWRKHRITASMAHQISHSRFANGKTTDIPQSYLKAVLGSGPSVQTPAMNWGVRNEKNAVRAYEKWTLENTGRKVQVDECGLFVHTKKNWMAASPDGIVVDALTGEKLGILEVKCPYKHREHSIRQACADRDFCLKPDGDSYALKTDHPYYTQVQCQLAATKMDRSDFVVYTKKDTAVVPVSFDSKFWEETESKLERFYFEAVIPNLNGKGTGGRAVEETDAWAVEE